MAKYLIDIRVVGDDPNEWVRHRATDCGWLPNEQERRELLGAAKTEFLQRYGHNGCGEISVMPWLPDDGNPPEWRKLAVALGVSA